MNERRDIIDLDALHTYLYERRDQSSRITIKNTELSEELGVDYKTLLKAVQALRARNVLRVYKKGRSSIIEYIVVLKGEDPDPVFEFSHRTIAWQ